MHTNPTICTLYNTENNNNMLFRKIGTKVLKCFEYSSNVLHSIFDNISKLSLLPSRSSVSECKSYVIATRKSNDS